MGHFDFFTFITGATLFQVQVQPQILHKKNTDTYEKLGSTHTSVVRFVEFHGEASEIQ